MTWFFSPIKSTDTNWALFVDNAQFPIQPVVTVFFFEKRRSGNRCCCLFSGSLAWSWVIIRTENKVAAFRGMHVSPVKHSYAWLLPRSVTRGQTDGQTDAGQSDPYVHSECMCRLRNIAMRDYQESVTTDVPDRRTDRDQTKWSLCAAMLRRRHKNM